MEKMLEKEIIAPLSEEQLIFNKIARVLKDENLTIKESFQVLEDMKDYILTWSTIGRG